jgi:hypothetical protein
MSTHVVRRRQRWISVVHRICTSMWRWGRSIGGGDKRRRVEDVDNKMV